MKIKELTAKLDEWSHTRSIATANDICEGLLEDMGQAARERYSEPTMEMAE